MEKEFQVCQHTYHYISKVSDYSNLKILSLKQMLQRLSIAFAQVKACNTSASNTT